MWCMPLCSGHPCFGSKLPHMCAHWSAVHAELSDVVGVATAKRLERPADNLAHHVPCLSSSLPTQQLALTCVHVTEHAG